MGLGLCALKISRLYFFPKMRFFPFDCTKFSLHLCELKSINCKIDILQKNFFFSFCCLLPLGRAPVRSLTQASVTFQENRGLGHFFSLWTFQFFFLVDNSFFCLMVDIGTGLCTFAENKYPKRWTSKKIQTDNMNQMIIITDPSHI